MKWPVIKLHYLLVYATLGALMPYLPVYGRQVGLDSRQVGWVLAVFGLAILVAPPVQSLLADRWLSNRRLIIAGYGLSVVALAGLLAARSFPAILLAHLLFSLGFTALIPLLDGLTFTALSTPPEQGNPPVGYPDVRLYGSIGWMVPGLGLALVRLVGWTDPDTVTRLAITLAPVLAGLGFACAFALPDHRPPARPEDRASLPTVQAMRTLARPPLRGLLGGLFFCFVAVAMYFVMYPLYLQALDIDPAYIGLITNLGVVVEIACFLALPFLLGRLSGRRLMLIGAACTAVRLALMAACPIPLVAIASQVFHGPMILALYLLPPMFLDRHARPDHRNSVQGLYVMFCFGVARLLGAGACGHIAHHFSPLLRGIVAVFYTAAALAVVALFCFALALPATVDVRGGLGPSDDADAHTGSNDRSGST